MLARLAGGHTNESFVTGDHIVRKSWPGKPADELADEALVLDALRLPFATPRLVETLAPEDGRVVRVFTRCPGTIGPRFLAPDDHSRMHAAMSCLRTLHGALAAIPCGSSEDWLRRRLERVRSGSLAAFPAETPRVLERIASLLPVAPPTQWVHGDYHLGNLLWRDDSIASVVDFDDVGAGTATTEAALALLALARQPGEERFTYDAALWRTGCAAYGSDLPLLVDLFAAYQVLIHLAAVQRGSWTLATSLGFWPCWYAICS